MRLCLLSLVLASSLSAQLTPSAEWAAHAFRQYQVTPNVTYLVASGQELKLDVYQRRDMPSPNHTVVFFHGGFWVGGAKENSILSLLPWMEMGWNVVNVEYRLGRVAKAPAALEDAFCAMRFVNAQAKTYNIDTNRIVVTGESAGGHLALSMGIVPADAEGFDRACAGPTPLPKVAAVVNWYGVTDVGDVIEGKNRANAAMQWFGSMPDRMELAKRLSPLTYVRAGLPPILTVHGDADTTVPYDEAVRLHSALAKAGVPNQLLTIPAGKHGQFTPEERARIYVTVHEFLKKHGL